MPPLLALFLTIVFCVFVLRRFARDPEASPALWLPVIWIFFIGSRFPGHWLTLFGLPNFAGSTYQEGNTLDAIFFSILIVAGIRVLVRRGITFSSLARHNIWLLLFLAYCFVSIAWSDFPFVAFKRWIKTLGHPVMALIILTDPRPVEALRLVFKRCGFVMLTLSVLFIKYFPEYGRSYETWSGQAMYSGISLNKNELGYCCLIFGIFFFWSLVTAGQIENRKRRRDERIVSAGFLLMALWLLKLAQSATSLVTIAIGAMVIVGLNFRFVSKRFFGAYVIGVVLVLATLEISIGIYGPFLEMLGRNATLTDRTQVWDDVIALTDSPLVGAGFESFWLGTRLEILWAKWAWRPNQAHNGYIETYINLGLIGLSLLVALLVSTFRKISTGFFTDFDFARLKMAFFFAIILYNFTEASFKALHLLWTIFYIIAFSLPKVEALRRYPAMVAATSDEDERFPATAGNL